MAENASGSLIFLHYSFVCVEEKLRAGKVSRDDFENLIWLVENKLRPNPAILEKCFPEAVSEYKKTCAEIGCEPDFSRRSVSFHWRHRHNDGNCPVSSDIVKAVRGKVVATGGESYSAINMYGLSIQVGDTIYTHRCVIAEVESATAR